MGKSILKLRVVSYDEHALYHQQNVDLSPLSIRTPTPFLVLRRTIDSFGKNNWGQDSAQGQDLVARFGSTPYFHPDQDLRSECSRSERQIGALRGDWLRSDFWRFRRPRVSALKKVSMTSKETRDSSNVMLLITRIRLAWDGCDACSNGRQIVHRGGVGDCVSVVSVFCLIPA